MSTTFAIPENPPGSQPVDAPSVWQRFAPDLPAERVMWSEIVPGGCHWSWVMPRGSRLRMVALEAGDVRVPYVPQSVRDIAQQTATSPIRFYRTRPVTPV